MSQVAFDPPIARASIRAKPQPASLHDMQDVLNDGPLASVPDLSMITSQSRVTVLILTLSLLEALGSFSTGLLTIELPTIVSDIHLDDSLILWPQAVYGLTSSVLLLVAGSIADVLGARTVFLAGNFLVGCFILACGLSRTGNELIAFRALQGVSACLVWPTSISVLTRNVESGRRRNIGFGFLGMSQPLGFMIGLVAAGGIVDSVGWRVGWYISGAATLALFVVSMLAIPAERKREANIKERLKKDIDWIGATLASTALALLSYVLAQLTSSGHEIHKPINIALLAMSVILMPTFVLWTHRQERLQKPALIPNSVWRNRAFTSTCLMVLASSAVAQTMELFCSLFFQEVQHLSALQASIRFLPAMLFGAVLNVTTGLVVHKVPAIQLILATSILSAGGPLLMATINPEWTYWAAAFPAQLLEPLSIDVLLTVGMLVVSEAFPEDTQALAGGIFSTAAQLGNSLGLAIMGVISTSVTAKSHFAQKQSAQALLVGYRASFWAAFAWMVLACLVGFWGLRKVGKVGLKRD
jgi:MFS family permease